MEKLGFVLVFLIVLQGVCSAPWEHRQPGQYEAVAERKRSHGDSWEKTQDADVSNLLIQYLKQLLGLEETREYLRHNVEKNGRPSEM